MSVERFGDRLARIVGEIQLGMKRGDRVKLQVDDRRTWHGVVTEQKSEDEVLVRWDHSREDEDLDICFPPALEREK